MSAFIKNLRPVAGRRVPHPDRVGECLKASGERVEMTGYWLRRLQDRDVEEVPAAVSADSTPDVEESPSAVSVDSTPDVEESPSTHKTKTRKADPS